ncbi:MAG: 30S ribosomal protein S13 [Nanoarchaeota archaeon]|nr:30S ribosomal protein S13 [Nanoarchaeota archaeon]
MADKKKQYLEESDEILVRISGYDVPGNKNIYTGLTRIKGVSWNISNALCTKLNLDRNKKISELSKDRIAKIEQALKNLEVLDFIKNRRVDFDSGESTHLFGVELEMRKEFDIKRLKKIKSYKGMRHALKLPVRGQRTRSHFRKTGIAVGVKRPKVGKKS